MWCVRCESSLLIIRNKNHKNETRKRAFNLKTPKIKCIHWSHSFKYHILHTLTHKNTIEFVVLHARFHSISALFSLNEIKSFRFRCIEYSKYSFHIYNKIKSLAYATFDCLVILMIRSTYERRNWLDCMVIIFTTQNNEIAWNCVLCDTLCKIVF